MNRYENILKAIEKLITQREAVTKKRTVGKESNKGEVSNVFTTEWTLTQLHAVAIIKENKAANNNLLAQELDISKPAVTKAVKKLLNHNMIIKIELEDNKKETYYTLTEAGEKLAFLHNQLHEKSRERYIHIFEEFSDSELEVVQRFLETVARRLQD